MADENVPVPTPTRSNDQILPFAAWVPIGKSNHVLDLQKRKKNPIFQIDVHILQNTNFFRAFTASASVPAIYIQELWNTLTYVEKAGTYRFQLDEDWFTLDTNFPKEALEITPIDQPHPFVSPPSGDAIMDFVNELGYPEVIHFVSSMAVNHLYQPWRAILSMINQCLTCMTSGHDRPIYPVLQMLWGIITSTNVDYAELIIHNIHQRSASPFHLAEEDLRLGNLKFVSKGKIDEVFGMPIPNELISKNIRNASYYNAYLEMVAKHDQKVAAEKEGKKKSACAKQPSQSLVSRTEACQRKVNPEPTHDEFMADLYPKVQESLKFLADEHVILEDPLSSTGTLSSMKNLEDAYAIRDQFINDKSTDDELRKLNVEAEVVSMVTVPIYQASSSVPPLSTRVIDLSPPKLASSTKLVERVAALEKKLSDLEHNNKNLDNITQNLRYRVYTLELRDLPHKINEEVHENVKEVVQIALLAPLRDRFRDLSEEDMKEMLHQMMFETGSYKSLPEHIALYESLEVSMERAQRDELLAEKDKSRKRRHDWKTNMENKYTTTQPQVYEASTYMENKYTTTQPQVYEASTNE
ncbi:hypothetical protein Tco_0674037 [Tanacetum coccineum]